MKKRKIFLIIPLLVVFLLVVFFGFLYLFTPRDINSIDLKDLDNKEFKLTEKDYREDFNFAYDTLKTYYPYFKINEEIYGINWLANKKIYTRYVSRSENDEDFFNRMNDVLADLHNGHTHLVDRDFGFYSYLSYYSMPRADWRNDIANMYEKDKVRRRYKIDNKTVKAYIKNHYGLNENTSLLENYLLARKNFAKNASFFEKSQENTDDNLEVEKIIDQKLAYIKIKKMLSPEQMGSDELVLDTFLQEIKDYPNLVIDIRGNGGGDSRYWQEFLFPKIIGKSYKTYNYSFLKKGDLNNKVILQEAYHANVKKFLDKSTFPKKIKKILKSFDYYNDEELIIDPKKDSINYKGNIYLLVDHDVYSSAEMLASFCKETKLAKLVGSRTAGDGIGSDPMQIDLPNTGFVLRFSKNLGLTASGSINELDQTSPDIKADTSDFEKNLIDENIIKAVIKDAKIN
ncbi:MAG: S41 family peptidase [Peptoniphilaceae bacterium]|nr:S41 family peptidase [Peptoniphilaceae bacterium]MDY6018511.1 S41 family peptidase [Anaerococcus sp.]